VRDIDVDAFIKQANREIIENNSNVMDFVEKRVRHNNAGKVQINQPGFNGIIVL
jgi:hypothetical protein